VIDTGIRPHADLAGQTVAGYDMIIDPAVANDGNGRDNDPSDPGPRDFDLYLYGNNGRQLSSSIDNAAQADSVSYSNNSGAVVTLFVRVRYDSGGAGSYTLNFSCEHRTPQKQKPGDAGLFSHARMRGHTCCAMCSASAVPQMR
jgi:hypothetical protein